MDPLTAPLKVQSSVIEPKISLVNIVNKKETERNEIETKIKEIYEDITKQKPFICNKPPNNTKKLSQVGGDINNVAKLIACSDVTYTQLQNLDKTSSQNVVQHVNIELPQREDPSLFIHQPINKNDQSKFTDFALRRKIFLTASKTGKPINKSSLDALLKEYNPKHNTMQGISPPFEKTPERETTYHDLKLENKMQILQQVVLLTLKEYKEKISTGSITEEKVKNQINKNIRKTIGYVRETDKTSRQETLPLLKGRTIFPQLSIATDAILQKRPVDLKMNTDEKMYAIKFYTVLKKIIKEERNRYAKNPDAVDESLYGYKHRLFQLQLYTNADHFYETTYKVLQIENYPMKTKIKLFLCPINEKLQQISDKLLEELKILRNRHEYLFKTLWNSAQRVQNIYINGNLYNQSIEVEIPYEYITIYDLRDQHITALKFFLDFLTINDYQNLKAGNFKFYCSKTISEKFIYALPFLRNLQHKTYTSDIISELDIESDKKQTKQFIQQLEDIDLTENDYIEIEKLREKLLSNQQPEAIIDEKYEAEVKEVPKLASKPSSEHDLLPTQDELKNIAVWVTNQYNKQIEIIKQNIKNSIITKDQYAEYQHTKKLYREQVKRREIFKVLYMNFSNQIAVHGLRTSYNAERGKRRILQNRKTYLSMLENWVKQDCPQPLFPPSIPNWMFKYFSTYIDLKGKDQNKRIHGMRFINIGNEHGVSPRLGMEPANLFISCYNVRSKNFDRSDCNLDTLIIDAIIDVKFPDDRVAEDLQNIFRENKARAKEFLGWFQQGQTVRAWESVQKILIEWNKKCLGLPYDESICKSTDNCIKYDVFFFVPGYLPKGLQGGQTQKIKYTKTSQRFLFKGKNRIIYRGIRGAQYIKLNGEYKRIVELKK